MYLRQGGNVSQEVVSDKVCLGQDPCRQAQDRILIAGPLQVIGHDANVVH